MKEENQKLRGIEIRDKRNGDWLWIHKCVIECWAKIIKPQGITLYCLLANSDFSQHHPGIVYPSQKRMAEVLGWSRQTVNKWIGVLEENKLITIEKRGRYYLIYYLNKVKCPNSKNGVHRDVKLALHLKRVSNPENQMSNSVNSDVKQHDTNKKKEKEQIKNSMSDKPTGWQLEKEVEKLLKDPRRHIQIIGVWIKEKGLRPENAEQMQSIIRRNLRPARLLNGYTNEDIKETIEALKRTEYLKKFTLETCLKYIDEIIVQKKKQGRKIVRFEEIKRPDGSVVMRPIYGDSNPQLQKK